MDGEAQLGEVPIKPLKQPQSSPSAKPHFIQKSPQELAAQMGEVHSLGLKNLATLTGAEFDARFKENKERLGQLLAEGVDDQALEVELGKIYRDSLGNSSYSPDRGENADIYLDAQKRKYRDYGYSEDEALSHARERIKSEGYLAEVRRARKESEARIAEDFQEGMDKAPWVDPYWIGEYMRRLGEIVQNIDDPETAKLLKEEFVGGNYLFHGTQVAQGIKIFQESGELMNGAGIEEKHGKGSRSNSGYEGISWNFNQIGALPGDRYHMVGFLASPGTVLREGAQLAIPSRPAPHELILIDGEINADRFYSAKTQKELYTHISAGADIGSVLNNLITLSLAKDNMKIIFRDSTMLNLSDSKMTNDEMATFLRSKYKIRENGTIELSSDLHQQVDKRIPPGAVWIQALIDSGRIKQVSGFEDAETVRDVIDRFGTDPKAFYQELAKDEAYIDEEIAEDDAKVGKIEVPVQDMYFVVPARDLEKWKPIIANSGNLPKGILVYDHNKVRLENFATSHRGDNTALDAEIRKAVPVSDGYIDWESQLLGEQITPEKLAGHKRHIVGERYLSKRKSLKEMDGQIQVV